MTRAHESLKRLPVVDAEGMLQGNVSRADLLKFFLRSDEEPTKEIRTALLGHLFAVSEGDLQVTAVVEDGLATLRGRLGEQSSVRQPADTTDLVNPRGMPPVRRRRAPWNDAKMAGR